MQELKKMFACKIRGSISRICQWYWRIMEKNSETTYEDKYWDKEDGGPVMHCGLSLGFVVYC